MVGGLVLKYDFDRKDVKKVTSIVRKKTGLIRNKLIEVVYEYFVDISDKAEYFKNKDICFYCIGVYTVAVAKEKFNKITVDYTATFLKL